MKFLPNLDQRVRLEPILKPISIEVQFRTRLAGWCSGREMLMAKRKHKKRCSKFWRAVVRTGGWVAAALIEGLFR